MPQAGSPARGMGIEAPISAPRAPMRVETQIDLASPAQGAVLREPLAHVSGSVRVMRDVVLLIDRSAEVRATRAYLAALDPASDRAGVLSFTVDTEVVAPLGTSEAAAAALAAWKPERIVSHQCWLQKPDGGGATVHAVNFGSPSYGAPRNVAREVADLSAGMFVDMRDEGADERLVALARRAIEGAELRNLTTRELGSIALSADGRAFAGEVTLAPGENRLGLRFLLPSSIGFARELVVDFQPSAIP